jgi:hypothetical protein
MSPVSGYAALPPVPCLYNRSTFYVRMRPCLHLQAERSLFLILLFWCSDVAQIGHFCAPVIHLNYTISQVAKCFLHCKFPHFHVTNTVSVRSAFQWRCCNVASVSRHLRLQPQQSGGRVVLPSLLLLLSSKKVICLHGAKPPPLKSQESSKRTQPSSALTIRIDHLSIMRCYAVRKASSSTP